MIRGLVFFFLLLAAPVFVGAQGSSEFTIQVFGSEDVTAPSTPTILSADAVVSSQVDLVWSTSTDNHAVFGYVLFRDGAPIATTTQLSYSDTGLTASTTYTYEVVAFDGVPLYSSTSAAVVVTTPDVYVPPVLDSGTEGTIARVVLSDFELSVGVATATMNISTRAVSRIEVRIGTTSSYELKYFVGNLYQRSHAIYINDLSPSTKYYYEVVGYTPQGMQTVLHSGSFVTKSDQPPLPPTNVSGLIATQNGDDVILQYSLPVDFPKNALVRVVRSHFYFPQYVSDGVVLYEGDAESVTDNGVFGGFSRAFYTVFVIDPNGLVSSGAVLRINDGRINDVDESDSDVGIGGNTDVEDGGEVDDENQTPGETGVTPVVDLDGFPKLSDFSVIQNEQVFPFSTPDISLTSEVPFMVSVPAEVITGDFKTMVATLSDPRNSGKQFSFLLRLNSDRSAYTAVLAPLMVAGESVLAVEVFDYDVRVISTYQTTLSFTAPATASSTVEVWYWRVQAWLWGLVLVVPLLVLGGVWFMFWRRGLVEDNE